jgi:hypothetical protein
MSISIEIYWCGKYNFQSIIEIEYEPNQLYSTICSESHEFFCKQWVVGSCSWFNSVDNSPLFYDWNWVN